MNTQDGYDWPTPHPLAPEPLKAEAPQPRWRCATCADTGILISPTPWPWSARTCPACRREKGEYQAAAHAAGYPGF